MQGELQVLRIGCSLAQGPGVDRGRCCRALSKGLELQPRHWSWLHNAANTSCTPQGIHDQGFLETCPCCRHRRMLALPRVHEEWRTSSIPLPRQGEWCLLHFHVTLLNPPIFQEPEHLNPCLLLLLSCLLQKLPMCQVRLWLLLAIRERIQEQSGREFCNWESGEKGREARFKFVLGRGKCCSSSNIFPRAKGTLGAHPSWVPIHMELNIEMCNHISLPNTLQSFSFHSPPQGSPKHHTSQLTSNVPLTTGDSQPAADLLT